MCITLCSCGTKNNKADEDSVNLKISMAVNNHASVYKVLYSASDCTTSVTHKEKNDDGSYDVAGKISLFNSYGDEYVANFDATVVFDKEGQASCSSFDMDTLIKK